MCPSSTPHPDLLKTVAAVPWSEHLQKSPRIRPRLKSVADEEGNQVRFIDMTGVDLRRLVHKAYELSCPVGNGHLDYEPGSLAESEVQQILSEHDSTATLSMDYVKGRLVKFVLFDGRGRENMPGVEYYLPERWGGEIWIAHSDRQLRELLEYCLPAV